VSTYVFAAFSCLLQRVVVCCSVLQCVAVYCSVLQCKCGVETEDAVAIRPVSFMCPTHVLPPFPVCCNVLQCVAVCCSVLQCVAVCCRVLQCKCGGKRTLKLL